MMYVYSGKCRLGTVGDKTSFQDAYGKPLFVGDIVCVFHEDVLCGGLTAVVSDEFTSYSDGTHKIKDGPVEPFVMGIKAVSLEEPSKWKVLKVKNHTDVIDGEKWRDYGFNYSND